MPCQGKHCSNDILFKATDKSFGVGEQEEVAPQQSVNRQSYWR